MNLQTFQAPTMAAAIGEVKRVMGPDAVILHTRNLSRSRWLGLRRTSVVEVTAARNLRVQDRPRRHAVAPAASVAAPMANPAGAMAAYGRPSAAAAAGVGNRLGSLSGGGGGTAVLSPPAALGLNDSGRHLLETPAAKGVAMLNLANEMTALKAMVKDLVATTRSAQCPNVPSELLEYYTQLVQSEVTAEIASDIIKTLQKRIRPEYASNGEYVRERIAEEIEKLLPSSGPIVRTKNVGPHVVALIGPTGVGKTTTIAKLAANLQLREKRRVGLITIDTFRIAAIDQLKKYADILGSPLRVVGSPEDLRDAVRSMDDCDFVLIDTAGRSPNDTMKLNELKTFLAAAAPDEVHLVLSTVASRESVELAVARFSEVRVDKILFTKIDEAAHVGVVLNVAMKVNKALSYVTTGQDVPDDIEVGRGRRLAQMILGTTP